MLLEATAGENKAKMPGEKRKQMQLLHLRTGNIQYLYCQHKPFLNFPYKIIAKQPNFPVQRAMIIFSFLKQLSFKLHL